MMYSTAEGQPVELTEPLETIHAAELFSKLSASAQEFIIDLIKSLLSDE